MRNAGSLTGGSARELAELVHAERIMERSLGLAALNALLPRLEEQWTDGNAEEILAERGADGRVAVVGHFPFVERLRERVGTLWVLEMNPQEGDLPAEAAPDILPQADVVAITGTTLLNDTFAGLDGAVPPRRAGDGVGAEHAALAGPVRLRRGHDFGRGGEPDARTTSARCWPRSARAAAFARCANPACGW